MKNKLVSVIIPVYNVEKYLDKCIKSLICQTYKKIEILLINDGSTDNSGSICDSWSKRDERIKVIHKKNEGVSSARNIGLDRANGEYLIFVDSDDYVEKDYIEKMIEYIYKYDMVSCGYYVEYQNKRLKVEIMSEDTEINNDTANNYIFKFNGYKGFTWNKIFIKKIITDNNIRFDAHIHMCEDQLFVVEYLSHCKNVLIIHDCLYNYRVRKTSLVSGIDKTRVLTIFDAYKKIKKYYANNNIECIYFLYSSLWFYYEYKKYINKKIYYNLELNKAKNDIFRSRQISFAEKIKLFIKMHLPFIYIIRNKHRDVNLNKFE